MALSEGERAQARAWFEAGAYTTKEIGLRLGVTKSTIIGMAHRASWFSPTANRAAVHYLKTSDEPETLMQRMQVLEDRMKAVLAETKGVGRVRA